MIHHPVINDLVAGNKRFLENSSIRSSHNSLDRLRQLDKTGQVPKAIILCCADSRAPVEIIFDQGIGDLFVIRGAGNIVTPSSIGSIEFAIMSFKTNLVIVMGHTRCGAVQASINDIDDNITYFTPSINDIIKSIRTNIEHLSFHEFSTQDQRLQAAVEANINASVKQIQKSSNFIETLIQDHQIIVAGALMDLSTGHVKFI